MFLPREIQLLLLMQKIALGSTSAYSTYTVKIDKTAPDFTGEISISNVGGSSFSMNVNATDGLSGSGNRVT